LPNSKLKSGLALTISSYSGVKGTRLFPGSEIVIIEGAGVCPPHIPKPNSKPSQASANISLQQHTTLGPLNKCGNAKINTFFQNGTLPGTDSFCPLEAGPFNITITDGLQKRSDLKSIADAVQSLGKRTGQVV
jgi:hypothetical protein